MTHEDIKWFVKGLREGQYITDENNNVVGTRHPSEAELKAADIIEELMAWGNRLAKDLEWLGY